VNRTDFLERLRSQIERDDLLALGAKVVVGVSGGADSTVLLHALRQISDDESAQYELHVAHLDHQLRGAESSGDAEFVAALADRLRLPKTIERCDLGSEADSERSSPEDLARRARLRFFDNVCKTVSATHVALAHHADDQVETVLHRFMRGTGVRGLSGMAIKRPLSRTSDVMLIKPLLAFSRREILDHAAANGLEYRHDSSNVSPNHTRNRIRCELLPLLEKSFNPQIREAISRLAEQSRWTNDFLRDIALAELARSTVERGPSSISLDRNQIAALPIIVQTSVMRLAIESLGMRERRLTFRHVTDIVEAISKENTRGRFSLPDGVDVRFDRHRITLSRNARKSKGKKTSARSEPIS
jgi:tRNA(Ile)-lysidine synthase